MLKPGLEEVKAYAAEGKYTVCPVCQEILSDFRTPVEVMRALMNVDEHCFMLESADQSKRWGRYTFLGYRPRMGITALDGHMVIDGRKSESEDPAALLRLLVHAHVGPFPCLFTLQLR